MTILVHGAHGFVGSHLVKRLRADGHSVTTIGRAPYDIPWQTFDALINCAAELTDESAMWESNVSLTHDLLKLMHKGLCKRFVQIGSSSEYGRTVLPRAESTLCVPTNVYEATKLAATALCQGWAERYDLDICVSRPFSLYGTNDKPRKLIPTLYRSFIDHKTISLYPGSHDWLYIDDFVDALIRLLSAPRMVTKGQIFNFGTGVSSTNHEVVAALEEALGGKLSIASQTDGRFHAHDVDNWVADASKARTVLGWAPKHDLRSGIKEYVMAEWFKEDRG